jgi:hypothetical protein
MAAHHVDGDLHLQGYQDDVDAHGADDITHERTDQPSDYTGVANRQLKEELDKLAFDELGRPELTGSDNEREAIEDDNQGDLENPDQRVK